MIRKKNLLKRLFSPTPKKWRNVRNTSGSAALAAAGAWTAMSQTGIQLPEEYGKLITITIGVLTSIALFAQSHESPVNQKKAK